MLWELVARPNSSSSWNSFASQARYHVTWRPNIFRVMDFRLSIVVSEKPDTGA